MSARTAGTNYEPQRGQPVRDLKAGVIGIYMDTQGGRLYLRPLGGGVEWTARPEHVGPVPPGESEVR